MARFKNDKGLTLIELLITIAVLAVVSAIALPVINNVVASSNSNALQQTIKDADAFINKYSKSGVVAYDGLTRTFQGYVDTDGDNQIDSNELIDTLTLDAKFSATANGSSPSVGGSYSNGGVTGATITSTSGSAVGNPTTPAVPSSLLVASDFPYSYNNIGGGWGYAESVTDPIGSSPANWAWTSTGELTPVIQIADVTLESKAQEFVAALNAANTVTINGTSYTLKVVREVMMDGVTMQNIVTEGKASYVRGMNGGYMINFYVTTMPTPNFIYYPADNIVITVS